MPIDKERFERGEQRYSIENGIVHCLNEHPDLAYNVHEVTVAALEPGWSEANVETDDVEDVIGPVLDLATVSSIRDSLADNGGLKRRVVDVGDAECSGYRGAVTRGGTGAVGFGVTRASAGDSRESRATTSRRPIVPRRSGTGF